MKTIIITGSPWAWKNTTTDALSERFRISDISHTIIDPDELSRTHPGSIPNLKWDAVAILFPFYKKLSLDYLIIPVTLDDDSDLQKIGSAIQGSEIQIVHLEVDVETLKKRVTDREPNEYRKNRLVKQVESYSKNWNARTFETIQIDNNLKEIEEVVEEIFNKILI